MKEPNQRMQLGTATGSVRAGSSLAFQGGGTFSALLGVERFVVIAYLAHDGLTALEEHLVPLDLGLLGRIVRVQLLRLFVKVADVILAALFDSHLVVADTRDDLLGGRC
jgi:hypothetical protein